MDFVADTLLDGRQFGAHGRGSLELAQSNNQARLHPDRQEGGRRPRASGKAVWLPEAHHLGNLTPREFLEQATQTTLLKASNF